jgi:uncharacterized iron-regulated protein
VRNSSPYGSYALAGLLCLLLAGTGLAAPAALHRDHPLNGTLWDTRSGRQVDEESFLAAAVAARWVLLGEKHDNAEHHRFQAEIVGALGRSGRRPAVVWEMAEPEPAAALRAASPDRAAELGAALDWEARGWPDWSEYLPIAEQALAHGLPMLPGKPPRNLVRAVSRGEPLPDDLAERLDWSRAYPTELEADLRLELAASHCGVLPDSALPGMARVQRLWDAWMADALREGDAETGDGAVLIAGSGHVRRDRAVPWHLPAADRSEVVTLALVEVAAGRDAAADYAAFDPRRFDYVRFTARVDEKDPCASFEGKRTD